MAVLRRLSIRLSTIAVFAVLASIFGMASAFAHVTVASPSATQGGYAVITFNVPSESPTASTTKLTVKFPADTPLASARVQPVPGWTAVVTTQTLPKPVTIAGRQVTQAVDTIVWTATDGGLSPSEYQQFSLSGGPMPESKTMTFKALQTYSDGTEVDWVEVPAAGSTTEPDHPAPVLTLAPSTSTSGDDPSAGPTVTATEASSSSSSGTKALSIAALVISIVALGAAGFAVVRRSKAKPAN